MGFMSLSMRPSTVKAGLTLRDLDDAELSWVSGGAPMWASYGSMDNYNLYSSMPDTTNPEGAIQTDDHNSCVQSYAKDGMNADAISAAVVSGFNIGAMIAGAIGGLALGYAIGQATCSSDSDS